MRSSPGRSSGSTPCARIASQTASTCSRRASTCITMIMGAQRIPSRRRQEARATQSGPDRRSGPPQRCASLCGGSNVHGNGLGAAHSKAESVLCRNLHLVLQVVQDPLQAWVEVEEVLEDEQLLKVSAAEQHDGIVERIGAGEPRVPDVLRMQTRAPRSCRRSNRRSLKRRSSNRPAWMPRST